MLAKTHGQPASPTRLGKEFYVFVERLEKQIAQVKAVPFSAKFGGATGNLNAHHVAYPNTNWVDFANDYVFIDVKSSKQDDNGIISAQRSGAVSKSKWADTYEVVSIDIDPRINRY